MTSEEFRQAVIARTNTLRKEMAPAVDLVLRNKPLMSREYAIAVNVTQNVVKETLAASMNEFLPQAQMYFGEVAVRAACYAISAVHPNDQEIIAVQVQKGLLRKLADMQAMGHTIQGEWE